MATITTDTYLDGGTARTAGEAWTCNGGRLTIRTDSRWHANAPASMTGTLGSITISATLGGGYTIDSRNVRWLAITGGSGSAAIGTTVSQGGVSGYFLGFWSSLTSAPSTTIGATGFIKLREVTGGTFAAGALSGITATAASSDVVGWIEVVHDQSTAITVPRLGSMVVRGDWFDLGVTTGSANQSIQLPTNGSTTTYGLGLWIANTASPTTDDDYDFYPAIYAAAMTTTNLGTDTRSKFVCMNTDGTLLIGHNGTTNVGYVPPSGRKIRVPNVFMRQCATTTRATNAIPHATVGTRPDFTTTSAGVIDWDHCSCDWYTYFLQAYSVRLENCALERMFSIAECASPLDIYDVGVSQSASADSITLTLLSCFAGGTIKRSRFHRVPTGTNDHAVSIQYCIGQTFQDCNSGVITYARTTSGTAFYATQCSNLTINNHTQFNGQMTLSTCFNVMVNDHDHVDRYTGTTNSTSGVYAIALLNNCANCVVDGVTFGLKGTIANCHPYLGVFNEAAGVNNKFRNLGSRTSFVSGGSANNPAYIYLASGNSVGTKVQRCYMTPTRTRAILTINSDKNQLFEHVYGDYADADTIAGLNTIIRACGMTSGVSGQASVYGTHWADEFTSDTVGRIVALMNEPTAETASLNVLTAGTGSGFTSAGGLALVNVDDEYITEVPYWIKGHDTLSATTIVVTGTNATWSAGTEAWGNHKIYYNIDTGSGYGEWGTLTSSEPRSINPVGTKIKFRIVCLTAAVSNLISFIRLNTTTSTALMDANMWPLDTATITINTITTLGTPIQNVYVLVLADNGGYLPSYETVTITNSGTTATVTHTAHVLSSGDSVMIKGASHYQNNGVFVITKINNDSYSYTMVSTPGSNPTGTITATYVFISGTTDVNGQISASKEITETQPVVGWARKSSSAPYYKTSSIFGTMSTSGTTISAVLIPDE